MHGSYAYEVILDPDDPAWDGHAEVLLAPLWWTRRSTHVAAAALGVAALVGAVLVLLSGASSAQGGGARQVGGGPAAHATSPELPVIPVSAQSVQPVAAAPSGTATAGSGPVASTSGSPGAVPMYDAAALAPSSRAAWTPVGDGGVPMALPEGHLGSYGPVSGDIDGLDSELLGMLSQMAGRMHASFTVISGRRTHAEQIDLYKRYLSGTGNLAAVPGTSRHESGNAADVYVNGVALANVDGARAAAAAIGLGFPVPGEAWHVESMQ